MGYPPGERGYRVRSIATNHFFTSGNVIFDENIAYNSIHSLPASTQDYSSLPFLEAPDVLADSDIPAVPTLPPNPAILDEPTLRPHDLDVTQALEPSSQPNSPSVPVTPPTLHLQVQPPMPMAIRTRSRTRSGTRKLTEKGQLFEKDIEAAKTHLTRVREAAVRRGGASGGTSGGGDAAGTRSVEGEKVAEGSTVGGDDEDDDPFAALCNSGVFDSHSTETDSAAMAASLDAEDYLQRDVDSFCEATLLSIRSDVRRNSYTEGYDMSIPPATHWEAERRTDAAEWRRVTEKELSDLKRMEVYEDVEAEELPEGKKPIGCRWVYEFKQSESGGPPIYKARLVAQGFSQVPFVDYGATFAPVAKSVTVRFVTVYSALQGWHLQCVDATRAFLHGGLSNEIFMRRPPPLPPGLWRLLKSIYGLKQASRVWYLLLRKVLESLGFTRSEFDHALFIFKRTWQSTLVHCLLAMHVDDGLAGCNSDDFLTFIKLEIGKRFGIKDLGPVKSFVGIQFERDYLKREIWIHQEMYIDSLLAEHDLTSCNSVVTPLDPSHPLGREDNAYPAIDNLTNAYQHLIGSLLFLQLCSRPDISFAVSLLSQFCSAPLPRHYAVAHRVLRYLKGTKGFRLHYGGVRKDEGLSGLVDADWAGDKAGRASISGFVWSYGGGPISWSAKKQNCVALSSTEAEYVALTRAVQEGIWLRNSLGQIGVACPAPLVISTDNNGALSLASNDSSHGKSKHINIRYHFIRSHIENGGFTIVHTPGIINTADLFTKSLARVKFQEHVARLGLGAR